jgi:hypothetical protein
MKSHKKRKFTKLTSRKRNRSKYTKQRKVNIKNKVYKKKNYSKKLKYYGGNNLVNKFSNIELNFNNILRIVEEQKKIKLSIFSIIYCDTGVKSNSEQQNISSRFIKAINANVFTIKMHIGNKEDYSDENQKNFVENIDILFNEITELNKIINNKDESNNLEVIKDKLINIINHINSTNNELKIIQGKLGNKLLVQDNHF